METDATVTPELRKAVIQVAMDGPAVYKPKDRVIRRKQVADLFGVCVKTIDKWRRYGVLTPVIMPGRSKCIGYRESDVNSLMSIK